MKRFLSIAALALVTAAPAHANWGGGSATTAAAAYCGARAQGESQKKASDRAHSVLALSMQGGFNSNVSAIVLGMKDMKAAVNFQIRQMCPEYYGASNGSKPTIVMEDCDQPWNKKALEKFIKLETPDHC